MRVEGVSDRKIPDPWRRVEPVISRPRAPAPPTREKIDIMDVDLDADLAVPGTYAIRVADVTYHVTSRQVGAPQDALKILASCILELSRIPRCAEALKNAEIGATTDEGSFNRPPSGGQASSLKTDAAAVWFLDQPLEEGARALARILRSAEAIAVCKRLGIVVMLKA